MRIAVSTEEQLLCTLKCWRKDGRAIRIEVCREGRGKEGKIRNGFGRRREGNVFFCPQICWVLCGLMGGLGGFF